MAKRQLATKTEYEILAEFRYTLRQFMRFSESAAGNVGLTPQQHQALLAIKGFPGRERITIGELAERLQIRHHSAVGLANRLEAEKLIERTSGSDDRRRVYISLTAHGNAIIERLSALHHDELRRLTPQLQSLIKRIGRLSVASDSKEQKEQK
jgi:DNA-binding MarR family transcriptional regulator